MCLFSLSWPKLLQMQRPNNRNILVNRSQNSDTVKKFGKCTEESDKPQLSDPMPLKFRSPALNHLTYLNSSSWSFVMNVSDSKQSMISFTTAKNGFLPRLSFHDKKSQRTVGFFSFLTNLQLKLQRVKAWARGPGPLLLTLHWIRFCLGLNYIKPCELFY